MAEKKKHTIVYANDGKTVETRPANQAKQSTTGLRVGAFVCWVLALGMEILAFLILVGKVNFTFCATKFQFIACFVIDLIFVILGAQLWKKANHINPASKENGFTFWLYNNAGVIACVICFLPIIILFLINKDTDGKTKFVAVIAGIIAICIGLFASYDWNPVSQEQLSQAITTLSGETVYWTQYGKVYHTHEDCGALNRSDTLTAGSIDDAVAAGRERLCSFCAKKDNITSIPTDNVDDDKIIEFPENTAETAQAQ